MLNENRSRKDAGLGAALSTHPVRQGTTIFAQDTPEAVIVLWRTVADQIRPKVPKLAAIMDRVEPDDVDLEEKLARWERFYNLSGPYCALGGKAPYEAFRERL